MQAMHRLLEGSGKQIRERTLRPVDGIFDGNGIISGRSPENIVHHLPCIARVVDPDAQAPEFASAQGAHDIPKAIVPGMAAPLLEANAAGGKIQFVVRHQQLLLGNPEVTRQTGYGLATAVHIGGRLEQPALMTTDVNPTGLTMESGFGLENTTVMPGQQIDEPEARVMTGFRVLPARITQTYNETDWE